MLEETKKRKKRTAEQILEDLLESSGQSPEAKFALAMGIKDLVHNRRQNSHERAMEKDKRKASSERGIDKLKAKGPSLPREPMMPIGDLVNEFLENGGKERKEEEQVEAAAEAENAEQ